MTDIKTGDLVVVNLGAEQRIFLLDVNKTPHRTSARLLENGELGTVLTVTSPVMNESRYAWVLFNDKAGYVRSGFLKKV